MGTQLPRKRGHSPSAQFLPVYIVAGCKTKFSVKFVISTLENVYRDVLHDHMNQKKQNFIFPAIFGRHLEYLELPKGDMTTPTLGFLLRPYTIIIHREKNYIKKYGVQSLGSQTIKWI